MSIMELPEGTKMQLSEKEQLAISVANYRVQTYTLEELQQYAFDRMVDELIDEPMEKLYTELETLVSVLGLEDE
jgi:nucleoside-triphosphatase THEP1